MQTILRLTLAFISNCSCRTTISYSPVSFFLLAAASASSSRFFCHTAMTANDMHNGWLDGIMVRASVLRSSGHGFNSRSGRYQATSVNSAFHPFGVSKSEYWPGRLGLRRGAFTCVGWQVTLYDPIWQVTPRSSETDSHEELYTALTFLTTLSLLSVVI